MSGSAPANPEPATKPAWWLWLLIGAVLVVITLIIVLVAVQLPSGGTAGAPTPGTSSSPSSTPTSPSSAEPTPVPVETPSAVPIDEPGTIQPGITASIDRIEAVQGEAKGPGEVAGPAIRFQVSIVNTTSQSVDLSSTVVTVDYGADRTPALQLSEPGGSPLPTSVAAGKTATGVYIFTIPVDQRGLVHITVDYTVGVPPLEFTGPVPAA